MPWAFHHGLPYMKSVIPLLLFLLGCAGIYVGTVQAAFTALMRLSQRLSAERSDPNDALTRYLDEPRLLFIPARILLGIILVVSVELATVLFGISTWRSIAVLALDDPGLRHRLRAPGAAVDRARQPAGRRRVPAAVVPHRVEPAAAADPGAARPGAPARRRGRGDGRTDAAKRRQRQRAGRDAGGSGRRDRGAAAPFDRRTSATRWCARS